MSAPKEDPAITEALARWRAGDERGFAVIYGVTFEHVREIVQLRMGAALRLSADSGDVVQDVFLSLLRTPPPPRLETLPDLKAYLAVAVENRLRDMSRFVSRPRRDRRREVANDQMGILLQELRSPDPTPSQASMGKEKYEHYLRTVASLPSNQREAIVLARHLGLDARRAAECMGLETAGAFRALLSRALAKVETALQAGG